MPIISNQLKLPPGKGRKRALWIIVGIVLLCFIGLNAGAALHAYKLSRFVVYDGNRPNPEMMSSWDKAVFALAGGSAPKSRLKALPDFPYSSFAVVRADGGKLRGWESKAGGNTTSTVILCHGHGASRSSILPEASALHNLGFRVVLFDFRAHGESSGDSCSVGYYEADDIKAIWDHVVSAYPDDRIYLYGVSMGAVAVARAAAIYELDAEAIILEMPFNRLVDAVRGRVRLMDFPTEPASSLLTFWGGVQQGFWGFNHCTANYVENLDMPVLLQWGQADNRVGEGEIKAIQAAATDGLVQLKTYGGAGHRSLLKAAGGEWRQNVTQWLHSINERQGKE